ncbi:MAG: hypothetical protein BWZ10_02451 [candidate division BRC1 bacterium ADurb.BinA364]|nr:MAG: hypothetical protein BWZ10_02451 [candidate division BRC1 bacterium ADurb.BinA364]
MAARAESLAGIDQDLHSPGRQIAARFPRRRDAVARRQVERLEKGSKLLGPVALRQILPAPAQTGLARNPVEDFAQARRQERFGEFPIDIAPKKENPFGPVLGRGLILHDNRLAGAQRFEGIGQSGDDFLGGVLAQAVERQHQLDIGRRGRLCAIVGSVHRKRSRWGTGVCPINGLLGRHGRLGPKISCEFRARLASPSSHRQGEPAGKNWGGTGVRSHNIRPAQRENTKKKSQIDPQSYL